MRCPFCFLFTKLYYLYTKIFNFASMERFLALIQNKYFIAGIAFFIWMCFFDRYDFSTQFAYQREKNKLQTEKQFYETEISRIEKTIKDVQYNPAEIQRVARERYKMKKDNEDIYVIQEIETD